MVWSSGFVVKAFGRLRFGYAWTYMNVLTYIYCMCVHIEDDNCNLSRALALQTLNFRTQEFRAEVWDCLQLIP